jgi:hypothetical protein
VARFAEDNDIPMVKFKKGIRKADVMRPLPPGGGDDTRERDQVGAGTVAQRSLLRDCRASRGLGLSGTELPGDAAGAAVCQLVALGLAVRGMAGPLSVMPARARMVSTAVSRGRVSRWTCARRSPP